VMVYVRITSKLGTAVAARTYLACHLSSAAGIARDTCILCELQRLDGECVRSYEAARHERQAQSCLTCGLSSADTSHVD
jgi:hypothetical protein